MVKKPAKKREVEYLWLACIEFLWFLIIFIFLIFFFFACHPSSTLDTICLRNITSIWHGLTKLVTK